MIRPIACPQHNFLFRFLCCLGRFVGSDILAGTAPVSLAAETDLRSLIDLGTNGEIVLGNQDRILMCFHCNRTDLLEIAPCRIEAAGNTALWGAKMVLLSPDVEFPSPIEPIPLASEPGLQDTFVACPQFPEM